MPKRSAISTYHNSPIDLDANSSGSHSHSHSHYRSPGSSRRVAYSPSSHNSKRRRPDRSYERSSEYHYSSKRNNDAQNHRHSREIVTETYDLTTSSSRVIPSNRKRRAPHSPSPVRTSKRHSRSHSPRAFRSLASPTYYTSRSNRSKNEPSPRNTRSPTPPTRKLDISNKIPDTSLFAELVKDKHKRDKVLKEIIDKQEEKSVNSSGENSNCAISNNNNLVVIDTGKKHDKTRKSLPQYYSLVVLMLLYILYFSGCTQYRDQFRANRRCTNIQRDKRFGVLS